MLFLVQGCISTNVWFGQARDAGKNKTMRLVDAVDKTEAKSKFKNFFEKHDETKDSFHYIVNNIEVLEMIK